MQLSVHITGDKEFIAKIHKFRTTVMDFKADFTKVGDYLVKYYSTNPFFTNGSVYGKSWAALTADTQAYKGKNFPGTPPLIRTGVMSTSFAFTSTSKMLSIGNTTDYFKYHQSSLPRKGNLPRRLIMAINETLKSYIKKEIKQGIINRMKGL